ncbi:MAG TPA: hypothetical protein VN112_18030 [Ensifer sp.]|nr:hypothetical protein [Ensifer sp.]
MTEGLPTARKTRKGVIIAFVLSAVAIVLFALAPVLSAFLASGIADAHGCALDEGGVHPCIIGGNDYGETLSFMFVLAWFGLITIPLGALGLVVWCIVLAIIVVTNIRSKKT